MALRQQSEAALAQAGLPDGDPLRRRGLLYPTARSSELLKRGNCGCTKHLQLKV
jgi:hypothetical protein